MRRRELIASLGSILALWPLSAPGQTERTQSWPTHPVKLIVGFAPGGPTDLVARLVGQKLTEQTGKNFFVENVSGAGGNVGTVRAAKSPPDGYTFLVTGGNITNNQYLFAEPGYDPLKDFDAVTLAAATPVVLAVNPSVRPVAGAGGDGKGAIPGTTRNPDYGRSWISGGRGQDMDRLRSTCRHAQGHYCEASRHHRREPRATRREDEACGNGLCADWLHATGMCRVLPI